RDQANVFGNIGMGRTCPLAFDDAVVVVRMPDVGGLHLIRHIIGHGAQMLEIKAAKLSRNSFHSQAETQPRSTRRNEETKKKRKNQIRLAPLSQPDTSQRV